VASRDWIKREYIIKGIPCTLLLEAANIVYWYERMDMFQDEPHYNIPIE
jgi:hypothetical protein